MTETTSDATRKIHDLVRQGRATPYEGALLLQLRQELRESNERQQRRLTHPFLYAVVTASLFILALLGLRREA